MIRIAIVDDENIICSEIDNYILKAIKNKIEKADISVYYSGEKFLYALQNGESFDLIFMDIEMKEISGIDVSRYIRDEQNDQNTQIVFVTGKDGYDRFLFEYRPFGFIAKPVFYESVAKILKKYIDIYGDNTATFHYIEDYNDCWVKLENIIYFESNDRKVNMYLSDTDKVGTFYMNMSEVYEKVNKYSFFIIHKSYIVNEKFISLYQSDCVILTNGKKLPLSRSRRKEILKRQLEMESGEKLNEI